MAMWVLTPMMPDICGCHTHDQRQCTDLRLGPSAIRLPVFLITLVFRPHVDRLYFMVGEHVASGVLVKGPHGIVVGRRVVLEDSESILKGSEYSSDCILTLKQQLQQLSCLTGFLSF